jgi:GntR family transcriptional regulator/MocR family aminotransferase
VRKARRVYEARHRRVLDALSRDLVPWLEPIVSATGLHVAAFLGSRDLRKEREIAARALAAGVRFDRLSASYAEGSPRPGLVLGYGAISDARLDEGLRRIGSAVAAVVRG